MKFCTNRKRQQNDVQRIRILTQPFLWPATKSGGVLCNTLQTFECRSVRASVRQQLIIRVRFITLIPFEIISRNLAHIYSMTRQRAEINNGHSTYIFCGVIPLCNFQYKNRVRSITLVPFEIISQNLVEI